MKARTQSANAATHGREIRGAEPAADRARRAFQTSGMSRGRNGTMTSTASRPPRLTCLRYCVNVIPIALPTMKVAGSPTSVSSPAALLTIAVITIGPTKPTSRAFETRMMMGASRITVVAFGRNAHTTATVSTSMSRKRLPLPPVSRRNGAPSRSKMPDFSSTCATTMPPKRSAMAPPAVAGTTRKSLSSRMPVTIIAPTPSSAASAMSTRSKAMARITTAKIPIVR